jgi:hypothetical protein
LVPTGYKVLKLNAAPFMPLSKERNEYFEKRFRSF